MELSIDDVRMMVGGYTLELMAKEKEITELKKKIEELSKDKNVSEPRHLEVVKEKV